MLPKLSTAVTNAWEPREPEPLLQFLEQWAHLLPAPVQRHTLDTLVLPKVRKLGMSWLASASVLFERRHPRPKSADSKSTTRKVVAH